VVAHSSRILPVEVGGEKVRSLLACDGLGREVFLACRDFGRVQVKLVRKGARLEDELSSGFESGPAASSLSRLTSLVSRSLTAFATSGAFSSTGPLVLGDGVPSPGEGVHNFRLGN